MLTVVTIGIVGRKPLSRSSLPFIGSSQASRRAIQPAQVPYHRPCSAGFHVSSGSTPFDLGKGPTNSFISMIHQCTRLPEFLTMVTYGVSTISMVIPHATVVPNGRCDGESVARIYIKLSFTSCLLYMHLGVLSSNSARFDSPYCYPRCRNFSRRVCLVVGPATMIELALVPSNSNRQK